VIPTRGRADYLEVALASIVPQAGAAGAEVLVVSDGPDPGTAAAAARHGATLIALPAPLGANAARNAGIQAARAETIVFVDDDMRAPAGWLDALRAGMSASPDYEVFGGPMRPELEGGGPRSCGREPPPITTLDLGERDTDARLVWAANMAVRRSAFERVGLFDETITGRGEEEEWERRHAAAGGRIRYLAAAALEHRRVPDDATVRALSRAGYHLGQSARRYDTRKGTAPSMAGEVRTLVGCAWHTVRRRCAYGIVMGAHAAGRLREALAEQRSR
jgi:GT2 family glycosyltransferase